MIYIGWISQILLACCGIPAAIEAFRTKTCNISSFFLFMWLFGEIVGVLYGIHLSAAPLLFNYAVNIICIMVLIRYNRKNIKPKRCRHHLIKDVEYCENLLLNRSIAPQDMYFLLNVLGDLKIVLKSENNQ